MDLYDEKQKREEWLEKTLLTLLPVGSGIKVISSFFVLFHIF